MIMLYKEDDPCCLMEEDSKERYEEPWHWTDYNVFLWSQKKLSDLLIGLEIQTPMGVLKITEVKCEGNAVVYNRKNDFKQFYEIRLEMTWTGFTSHGLTVEGKVNVPYLSEEYDIEHTDIETHFVDDGAESSYFGLIMKNAGEKVIKDQLSLYVTALKFELPNNITEKQHEMVVDNQEEMVI